MEKSKIIPIVFLLIGFMALSISILVYNNQSENNEVKVCDSYSIQYPTTESICYDEDLFYSSGKLEVKVNG